MATTSGNGDYRAEGYLPGYYQIVPVKSGCSFSPDSLVADVTQGDSHDNDFHAQCADTTQAGIFDPLFTLIALFRD